MAPSGTLAERSAVQPSHRGCDGETARARQGGSVTGPAKNRSRTYQAFAAPCHSMSYPSSLVSEHMAAKAANLLVKTASAWDFS